MKKLLFVAMTVAGLSLASCGEQTSCSNVVSDTIDTVIVDSIDSVTAEV